MCAKKAKPPKRKTSGSDRFGYRPSPETRTVSPQYDYQIGDERRRRLLDRIQFDRLQRQWRKKNHELGRDGWEGFGNKELPIDRYKHDIMKMVGSNRISLLAGETGSGKSTQLAQYALEMGYDHIVYLQPRRVTTDNISERLEMELTEQFEQKGIYMPPNLVGMAHSDHATLRDDSVIQVMTSAVFKKKAPELRDEWKDKKVLIVADEVHEGNIETEFAVATAAELMTEKQHWNMVLMSATLNEEEIQAAYTPINGRPIPKLTVEGRPHEITYEERPHETVIDTYNLEGENSKKTLIFTDGLRSVGAITRELMLQHPDIRVLALHSKISEAERRAIFHEEADDGRRTVIVSTSAGQSGLTIPGVDLVIGDGWTKSPELDGENASGLPRRYCTQDELTQQMGRGGRDVDGARFFLSQPLPLRHRPGDTMADNVFVPFGERDLHIPADIYHTVITRNVLSAAAMDRDFYTLNEFLIHKVTRDTIREAYTVLELMGAVDEHNVITEIGREMDKYPLRPELARAVAEAMKGGLAEQKQIAAIAACIEAGGMASYDPRKIEKIRERLSTETKDDFLAELDYFLGTFKYINAGDTALSVYLQGETTGDFSRIDSDSVDDDTLIAAGYDVRNVLRAHKQYRKISQRMGITRADMYIGLTNTMTGERRSELQRMLLTGMPHLLYQEVARKAWRGRRKKDKNGEKKALPPIVWYRNMLGPEKGTPYDYDRRISNRSLLGGFAIAASELIAGYPHWYTDDDGEVHNVIERGIPATRGAVTRALGHTAASIREETTIGPDGHLRKVRAGSIGRLRTSRVIKKDRADSGQKVRLLMETALDRPGPAQRELRDLMRKLDHIARRIPSAQRRWYFEKPILSDHDLKSLLTRSAENVSSLGELDANLREIMRTEGISLYEFITPESLRAVDENMPLSVEINGTIYDIHYDEGDDAQPYISGFSPDQARWLPDHRMIPDGREILFRYHYDDGEGDDIRDLTAQEVKAMSKVE